MISAFEDCHEDWEDSECSKPRRDNVILVLNLSEYIYTKYIFQRDLGITQVPAKVLNYGAFVDYRLSKYIYIYIYHLVTAITDSDEAMHLAKKQGSQKQFTSFSLF